MPVDASGGVTAIPTGTQEAIRHALALLVLASLPAWLVMQVPAYRHSAGERRQQLKWLWTPISR
jgi:hypothetical protein